MIKLIVYGSILTLVVVALIVTMNINSHKIDCNKFDSKGIRIVCGGESFRSDYQGPVRPTDNELHFRLTGETVEVKN